MGFPYDRSAGDPKAAIQYGRDFNFYQKLTVTATTFNADADIVITFPTQGVIILNTGTTAANTIQYSLNGATIHGEINPALIQGMVFDNRSMCKIWFQLASGSSSTIISVTAWGTR